MFLSNPDADDIYRQAVVSLEIYGIDTYDEDVIVKVEDVSCIMEQINAEGLTNS